MAEPPYNQRKLGGNGCRTAPVATPPATPPPATVATPLPFGWKAEGRGSMHPTTRGTHHVDRVTVASGS